MAKEEDQSKFTQALLKLVSDIPDSDEPTARDPQKRARKLARAAARKAAGISATLALPPGPVGMLTILPDLLTIWHLQRQLVADIAAIYGKTPLLTPAAMVWCLFKHGGAALVRDLVVRVGERYVVKRVTLRFLQQLMKKIGVRLTQRIIGQTLSRWIPLVGAAGVGAYAYYDTTAVAANAIELFSSDVRPGGGDAGSELVPA